MPDEGPDWYWLIMGAFLASLCWGMALIAALNGVR